MAGVQLYDFQVDALSHMKNGCILNGDVGSGKSRTSLAYYYTIFGGKVNTEKYVRMKNPCDLYIITTARKRDTGEWEDELSNYYMTTNEKTEKAANGNKVVVDSWNNIGKYVNVVSSFFIFDEQRVVGYGAWTKAFLKITKVNRWILLSATPGDTWMDYLPVFIANGFFKNKTQFYNEHCIFSRFSRYPKIEKYYNVWPLIKMRDSILVPMRDPRDTIPVNQTIPVEYDRDKYKTVAATRWNIFKGKPIETAGEYCLVLRQIVNTDKSRSEAVRNILIEHPKAIIFYTYDYELDSLRELMEKENYPYSEWNGHKHEKMLTGNKWCYLVEYIAGSEGWNCTSTDTMIFYSQNYSYKIMKQAAGRINRMNTPFKYLYYFTLKSSSPIDIAISSSLKRKKKFNELKFAPEFRAEKKESGKDKKQWENLKRKSAKDIPAGNQ